MTSSPDLKVEDDVEKQLDIFSQHDTKRDQDKVLQRKNNASATVLHRQNKHCSSRSKHADNVTLHINTAIIREMTRDI